MPSTSQNFASTSKRQILAPTCFQLKYLSPMFTLDPLCALIGEVSLQLLHQESGACHVEHKWTLRRSKLMKSALARSPSLSVSLPLSISFTLVVLFFLSSVSSTGVWRGKGEPPPDAQPTLSRIILWLLCPWRHVSVGGLLISLRILPPFVQHGEYGKAIAYLTPDTQDSLLLSSCRPWSTLRALHRRGRRCTGSACGSLLEGL